MAESMTICLIGPATSGKTSLLASMKEAVDDDVHGYPPDVKYAIAELPSQASSDSAFGPLKFRNGVLAQREKQFRSGGLASTLPDQTYKYRLNLKKLYERGSNGAETLADIDLTVVDAAGELMFPDEDDTQLLGATDVRNELIDLMEISDAVVLVLKICLPESPVWKRDFTDIVDAVCRADKRRLKRFAVAFNQYERLFVRFGGSAFQYATHPEIARYALQQACLRADWLKPLQRLRASGVDVAFVPTSPYGFVKNFGNPNLTMADGAMERFDHRSPTSPLWRPFCSADPFIFAATGDLSTLMFGVDHMFGLGERPQMPLPPPPPMPPNDRSRPEAEPAKASKKRQSSWLKRITDTFNVNG
jgi:hypothetical protein